MLEVVRGWEKEEEEAEEEEEEEEELEPPPHSTHTVCARDVPDLRGCAD